MTERHESFTPEHLEECRNLLTEKRRQLTEDLDRLRTELGERSAPERSAGAPSDTPTHQADAGTETFDRELQEKLIEGHENRLLAIDEALGRLDAGTYGTCTVCGERIGMDRLRAKPWTTTCLDHAPDEGEGPGDRRTPKPWV